MVQLVRAVRRRGRGARPRTQPVAGADRTNRRPIRERGGTDGRVGNDTMVAVRAFQRKAGLVPADGYAGLKVLAKLRQGG